MRAVSRPFSMPTVSLVMRHVSPAAAGTAWASGNFLTMTLGRMPMRLWRGVTDISLIMPAR